MNIGSDGESGPVSFSPALDASFFESGFEKPGMAFTSYGQVRRIEKTFPGLDVECLLGQEDFEIVRNNWDRAKSNGFNGVDPQYNGIFSDLQKTYNSSLQENYKQAAELLMAGCFPRNYREKRGCDFDENR